MILALSGLPIEIRYESGLRDSAGHPAHAATSIRQRLIVLDTGLRRNASEHRRILAHEIFHFVWARLGNRKRLLWEGLLTAEFEDGVTGEAGWSAEWRKRELRRIDVVQRSRAWREYCCESFCDSAAAWVTAARREITLSRAALLRRKAWLSMNFEDRSVPV